MNVSVTIPVIHPASASSLEHRVRGFGVDVRTPSWSSVAEVKAAGGTSLGDSYAAALASETDATLVAGDDPEFDAAAVDVELHRVTE